MENSGVVERGLVHMWDNPPTAHLQDVLGWYSCAAIGVMDHLQLNMLEYVLSCVPDAKQTPSLSATTSGAANVTALRPYIDQFRQFLLYEDFFTGDPVLEATQKALWKQVTGDFGDRLYELHQALEHCGSALRLEIFGYVLAHIFAFISDGSETLRDDTTLYYICEEHVAACLKNSKHWRAGDASQPIDRMNPEDFFAYSLGFYVDLHWTALRPDYSLHQDWALGADKDHAFLMLPFLTCLRAFSQFRYFNDLDRQSNRPTNKQIILSKLAPLHSVLIDNYNGIANLKEVHEQIKQWYMDFVYAA
jgi:hypothetical protein